MTPVKLPNKKTTLSLCFYHHILIAPKLSPKNKPYLLQGGMSIQVSRCEWCKCESNLLSCTVDADCQHYWGEDTDTTTKRIDYTDSVEIKVTTESMLTIPNQYASKQPPGASQIIIRYCY